MTVSELIEELRKHDPHLEVIVPLGEESETDFHINAVQVHCSNACKRRVEILVAP